jgi:GTP-binding protein
MLVYVLALDSDPARDFEIVRGEVGAFDAEMALRPAVIALNKADLVPAVVAKGRAQELHSLTGLEVFVISAREHNGLGPLIKAVALNLKTLNTVQPDVAARL